MLKQLERGAPSYLPPHATLLPDAPLDELKIKIVEPTDTTAKNAVGERRSADPTLRNDQRPTTEKEETVTYQFLAPQLSDGPSTTPVPIVDIKITHPTAAPSKAPATATVIDPRSNEKKPSNQRQLAELRTNAGPKAKRPASPDARDNIVPRAVAARAEPDTAVSRSTINSNRLTTKSDIGKVTAKPSTVTALVEPAATSKPSLQPQMRSRLTPRASEVGTEISKPVDEGAITSASSSRTVNEAAGAQQIRTALLPPPTKVSASTKAQHAPVVPLPHAKPRREELAKRAALRQRTKRRAAAARRRAAKARKAAAEPVATTTARPQWARSALGTGN